MGIHCEINLHKPQNGAFVGIRGNIISGTIKYAVDHPTSITAITASIKGSGTLRIEHLERKDDTGNPETEVRRETYIDVDAVVQNYYREIVLHVGVYEMAFRIEIPHDIPPTLKYIKSSNLYNIRCKISYYVRIKFSKPGLTWARRFRKDINVISGLVPRLPLSPVTFGGQKKLTQLFPSKKSHVDVRATISNSVLRSGDKFDLHYEVVNNTNVVIKSIKVKVIEVYTFNFIDGREIVMEENVPDTDTKSMSILNGETQEMTVVVNMPGDRESLEFSNIVSREYFAVIVVKLPMPHRNYELKVPLQIGNIIQDNIAEGYTDLPPSYWEAMHEDCEDET